MLTVLLHIDMLTHVESHLVANICMHSVRMYAVVKMPLFPEVLSEIVSVCYFRRSHLLCDGAVRP